MIQRLWLPCTLRRCGWSASTVTSPGGRHGAAQEALEELAHTQESPQGQEHVWRADELLHAIQAGPYAYRSPLTPRGLEQRLQHYATQLREALDDLTQEAWRRANVWPVRSQRICWPAVTLPNWSERVWPGVSCAGCTNHYSQVAGCAIWHVVIVMIWLLLIGRVKRSSAVKMWRRCLKSTDCSSTPSAPGVRQ